MPFCPECKYEYVDGVSDCPDCNVQLVWSLDEPQDHLSVQLPRSSSHKLHADLQPSEEFVPCWEADDGVEAEAAAEILRGEKIPCKIFAQSPAGIIGFHEFIVGKPGRRFVMVPESRREEAQTAIEQLLPKLELLPTDEAEVSEYDEPVDNSEEDGEEEE